MALGAPRWPTVAPGGSSPPPKPLNLYGKQFQTPGTSRRGTAHASGSGGSGLSDGQSIGTTGAGTVDAGTTTVVVVTAAATVVDVATDAASAAAADCTAVAEPSPSAVIPPSVTKANAAEVRLAAVASPVIRAVRRSIH